MSQQLLLSLKLCWFKINSEAALVSNGADAHRQSQKVSLQRVRASGPVLAAEELAAEERIGDVMCCSCLCRSMACAAQ